MAQFPVDKNVYTPVVDSVDFFEELTVNPQLLDFNALMAGSLADFNRVVVVGAEANYTTVNEGRFAAVTASPPPSAANPIAILVLPGIYNEALEINLGVYISIIGLSRESCVIKPTATSNTPISLGGYSTLANLTIDRTSVTSAERTIDGNFDRDIIIRNCTIIGGGTGGANDGEIQFRGNTGGGKITISNCTIKNIGTLGGEPSYGPPSAIKLIGEIPIPKLINVKLIVENVSIINDTYPVAVNGIDIRGPVSGNNITVRNSTILTGDGITYFPIASTNPNPGAMTAYSINNSFRVAPEVLADLTDHNPFIDAGQVI